MSVPSYRDRAPKQIAGVRVLDFLNTVEWRGSPAPPRIDRLVRYGELVAWSEATGLVDRDEAGCLLDAARKDPGRASDALIDAIRFRESALGALVTGPSPDAVASLNALLAPHAITWRVGAGADGALRSMAAWPELILALPLQRLLQEFVAFVGADDRPTVRPCGNPRCGWVFADTSRRKNRRWCEMGTCGNKTKARSHYARRRGKPVSG